MGKGTVSLGKPNPGDLEGVYGTPARAEPASSSKPVEPAQQMQQRPAEQRPVEQPAMTQVPRQDGAAQPQSWQQPPVIIQPSPALPPWAGSLQEYGLQNLHTRSGAGDTL